MKIGSEVVLNDIEVRIAKFVGKRRYDDNVKEQTNNAKISADSDLKITVEGFAGEMAFCKLYNIYPDLVSECRTSAEDTGEGILEGKRIDVKATKYEDGFLLAPIWSGTKKVDVYCLLTGEMPTFIFRGFITKEELIVKHMIRDMGHGPTYGAAQCQLVEFENLKFGE